MLLAAAWYLTGEDALARQVDVSLRSWWDANPFLSGVNCTSGIELGVRLVNVANAYWHAAEWADYATAMVA